MTSKLFYHPISGECLGSTCVCGLYTVGGDEKLCGNCRPQHQILQLEAQVALLKAEVAELSKDKASLTDQIQTIKFNSDLMFKGLMAEMMNLRSEISNRDDEIYNH